jgi:hypothetical protein
MEKDIFFKPVQITSTFASDLETSYNHTKAEIIYNILEILEEKKILKIKDSNKINGGEQYTNKSGQHTTND